MFDHVPASWGRSGEVRSLTIDAQCGEYLTLQVGLWAAMSSINSVSMKFAELNSTRGGPAIPATAFTCFNLHGIDQHGLAFSKNYTLAKGDVGSLWVGVELPAEATATGKYQTTLTLTANSAVVELALTINVALVPTKQLCAANCTLVQVEPVGSGFIGTFDQSASSDISTLKACKAACLASFNCVQLTFQPRPVDPCVLYSAISTKKQYWAPNVLGFVKCVAGATNATSYVVARSR